MNAKKLGFGFMVLLALIGAATLLNNPVEAGTNVRDVWDKVVAAGQAMFG